MTCALVPEPLERVARDCGAPLRSSELHVVEHADGFVAKARLEVEDHPGIVMVRAHVAGATAEAAVDHACNRVRDQLDAMVKDPLAIGSSAARPRWTFGRAPAHRPRYGDKLAVNRSVVRTKTYDAAVAEPVHAIRNAALRDLDFYVFLHARDGRPSVVRRGEANDWELVEPAHCELADAIEMLGVSHARFVCFVDRSTTAPRAVYRRFDGDYALLSPA